MAIATTEQATTSSTASTETMQLVSFHLADETYGVEITTIREIILMCDITKVPQTPHYIVFAITGLMALGFQSFTGIAL